MIFKALNYRLFGATVNYIMGWFINQENKKDEREPEEADGAEEENKDEREPEVIFGDAKLTDKLVRECPFKNPLTAFINGFAKIMDIALLRRLVLLQLAILLPGMPRWHYNILAVAHKEKAKKGEKRSAIHTTVPNVHLPTGKRLQPYWHAAHWRTIEAGQELYNLFHDLPSPKHTERVFGVCVHTKKCGSAQQEFATDIRRHLIDLYDNGSLRSIDDVKSAIEEPFSCKVIHMGRSKKYGGYINIDCPAVSKKPFRLYGRFFAPDFLKNHGTSDMRPEKLSDAERDALIAHYRQVLTNGIVKKYEDYREKYALGPLSFWVVRQAPKEFHNYLTAKFLDRCFQEVAQMESPTIPQPELAQAPKRPTGRQGSAFSLSDLLTFFKKTIRKPKGGDKNGTRISENLKATIAEYLKRAKDILANFRIAIERSRETASKSGISAKEAARKRTREAIAKGLLKPVELDDVEPESNKEPPPPLMGR